MAKVASAVGSPRAFALAALALSVVAAAQPEPVVLSLDRFLTHPDTGASLHEVLPIAVYDGSRFRGDRESRASVAETPEAVSLLTRYPRVHVLRRGERIGTVTVSDVRPQPFQCDSLTVGTGDYETDSSVPASELSSLSRRRESGEPVDYKTETFLALSGAIDERDLDEPAVAAVTSPEDLQSYAAEVDRLRPRSELGPLGVDETRAYRFNGRNAVLVVRTRQAAAPAAVGNLLTEGTIYVDAVIVRAAPGRVALFPLEGFPSEMNGLGGGHSDLFVDGFALDGKIFFAFERRFSEAVYFRLYRLGEASETRLILETVVHGC